MLRCSPPILKCVDNRQIEVLSNRTETSLNVK